MFPIGRGSLHIPPNRAGEGRRRERTCDPIRAGCDETGGDTGNQVGCAGVAAAEQEAARARLGARRARVADHVRRDPDDLGQPADARHRTWTNASQELIQDPAIQPRSPSTSSTSCTRTSTSPPSSRRSCRRSSSRSRRRSSACCAAGDERRRVPAPTTARAAALGQRERVAHEKLVNVLEDKTGSGSRPAKAT